MKSYKFHIITFIAALLVADVAWGVNWSGEMSGTKSLTETVNITGTVTIKSGTTLTIKNTSGSNKTIRPANAINGPMFKIEDGGKLVMTGSSGNLIVINGRTTFDDNAGSASVHPFTANGSTYNLATRSTTYKVDEAIQNSNGTLTLDYVYIQNVNGRGSGGGILINGKNRGESRVTTIRNCTIRNCISEQGSAIQITNTNGDQKGNAEACKLVVENSIIEWNYSWGDRGEEDNGTAYGSGGTIRTNGGCVSNLYFKNVTVRNNFSGGAGGGIYWNGAGTTSTCCYFDGCTFSNNAANGQGGGMMLETTYQFKPDGGVTTITGNKVLNSGGSGGGIVVTSYGGNALNVVTSGKYTFNYDLTNKLSITNNTASIGAGISFNLGKYSLNGDWNNNDISSYQVTANINFNGATISGNTATSGPGGGIRIHNNTAGNNGNRKVIINVNLKGGTLSNNSAYTYGGGIYTYKTDIKNASSTDVMYISGNTASNDGGGIYVDGGTSIALASTNISDNSAVNGGALAISASSGNNLSISLGNSTISGNHVTNQGGAIYLPKGTLTIANPTISSNYAKTGGAIYIGGGSITTTGTATVENNYATGNGGAFYVSGGRVTMASPTIKGNGKNGSSAETDNGGAIYVTGTGAGFIATGTAKIESNAATANGGAIFVNGGDGVNLNACELISNTAGQNGGALYVSGANVTFAQNSIISNSAASGGAVFVRGGLLKTTGTATVENNYSTANGGAFYVVNGQIEMENPTIRGNGKDGSGVPITENGGAMFVLRDANETGGDSAGFTATGTSIITSNASKMSGGAICVKNGNITLAQNTISSNNSKTGGALYLKGGSLTTTTSATVKDNYSVDNGGAFYVEDGSVQMHNPTISGNGKNGSVVSSTNGGAIYVITDGAKAGFTATGTSIISSNASTTSGGALYVKNGDIVFANNSISSNSSKQGGAVYLEGGSLTTTGEALIQNNYSTLDGGAFYVTGGRIQMENPTINDNGKNGSTVSTANGGAIYVKGTGAGFAASGNVALNGNSANNDGGAVYVAGGNIDITGQSSNLTISENNANNGGAFYVNGGGIIANQISKATITNNYSTVEGGAFYVTGGNINLCDTELSGNGKNGSDVKTTNGGAIALYNGTFTFGNNSEIRGNAATGNGGALYITNAAATDITCEGGSYLANTAGLGGGIYASGPINLKFAANVRDNIAQNGGGLYLDGGVKMTFGNGLIVGNRAQVAQNVSRDASQYGVGGGIYLAKGKLSFSQTQNLGIYNNAASFEAADIYASGSETTIDLPNVSKMNLTGFDVPGNVLYWVNDFNAKRYEAALRDMKADIVAMILGFEENEAVKTITNKTTCLDLGYDLVFVKIHSKNLGSGDNAATEISYMKKGTSESIVYRKILFMGEETQIVGLPSGDWKFETTAWSSKYKEKPTLTITSGIQKEDPINDFYNITRDHNYEFDLTFTKKEEDKIRHAVTHEFKLINKMYPGGAPAN